MYIEQAYKGLYEWWRYILGIVIIFLAWQFIGMLPLGAALIFKTIGQDSSNIPSDIPGIMNVLGSNLFLFLMLFSFAVGLVGVFIAAKGLHRLPILNLTTSRSKIDWKRFWFIFILWGVVSSSVVLIDFYLSPEDFELNFKLKPFLILLVIAVILIPLQTSFEEYFFRGYLLQGIGVVLKNRWVPLLITSIGFGLMHIANPEVEKLGYVIMIYYIGTGLFLGIITLMDDGLELALGFHAANNLFTALLVTADWTAFQTHSILLDLSDPSEMGLMEIFVPVFVVFPILLFILSKKYNWTNWKEKCFGYVIEPSNIEDLRRNEEQ
ncbi:CPBP family intramembrane glutamic endopeptidase [Algibacter mikhailovii]|uniref:Abortive infection protein n=1 Tax=Algibacter mikhailovii TaxID=425498 RepID=A0A918V4T2_9FLAO|nr:CPBP family intramembrane glutamic endopeptidase [Algibacter mikhailovii]GGZ68692.1 abortive infection protein [Algibacter mikhailovii]